MTTPGKCIFCGAGGLTREHIWPVWSTAYFTPPDIAKHVRGSLIDSPDDPSVLVHEHRKERQGSVRNTTVRVVCKKCNGGWMSQLEQSAKPILIPLIQGESATITEPQQRILAAWATMKFMVTEWAGEARFHLVTPQLDRTYLKDIKAAPLHVEIMIGKNIGTAWSAGFGRHAAILPINIPKLPPEQARMLPKNAQVFVMGVGSLFILGGWTSFPHIANLDLDPLRAWLSPVWPPTGKAIDWPPGVILGDNETHSLATVFARFCDPNRRGNDMLFLRHMAGQIPGT